MTTIDDRNTCVKIVCQLIIVMIKTAVLRLIAAEVHDSTTPKTLPNFSEEKWRRILNCCRMSLGKNRWGILTVEFR